MAFKLACTIHFSLPAAGIQKHWENFREKCWSLLENGIRILISSTNFDQCVVHLTVQYLYKKCLQKKKIYIFSVKPKVAIFGFDYA